jgi:hypothetical protein
MLETQNEMMEIQRLKATTIRRARGGVEEAAKLQCSCARQKLARFRAGAYENQNGAPATTSRRPRISRGGQIRSWRRARRRAMKLPRVRSRRRR